MSFNMITVHSMVRFVFAAMHLLLLMFYQPVASLQSVILSSSHSFLLML